MMEQRCEVCEPQATQRLTVVAPNMLGVNVASQAFRTGISEVNMADSMQKDWRELCVAVTNESDSTKLTSLVQELIEALDRGERNWRPTVCAPNAMATNQETA
jgi:hypothetical protein